MKGSQSMGKGFNATDNNYSVAQSNQSIRVSTLASLNAKDQIPEHVIKAVVAECDTLSENASGLQKLWEDMRKLSSQQKGVLSEGNFSVLFRKFSNILNPLFHINEHKDLFEVLDEDNDGFLNEDEQVLLFSLVKGKMLNCAQKLLTVFEYQRFKQLMGTVRQLETDINRYQDTYRTTIYESEIKKYHEVGREKLDEFLEKYAVLFSDLEEVKNQRLREFFETRRQLRAEREKELNSDNKLVKFKPKRELNEYLKSEKLVALEERIEEATNYRKEREKISAKEVIRLNNNMDNYIKGWLKAFDLETNKQEKHLRVKLDNDENKLTIRMANEFGVLVKKIALHKNDIERIQTMSKKKALHRGVSQGELFRLKETLIKQNDIIMKSKAALAKTQAKEEHSRFNGTSSTLRGEADASRSPGRFPSLFPDRQKNSVKNLETLKKNKDLIRFYIRQKFGADIPVNVKLESYQQGDDQHHKIEKYLKGKTQEEEPVMLSHLYNRYLEEKKDATMKRDKKKDQEMQRTMQAKKKITDILNVENVVKH